MLIQDPAGRFDEINALLDQHEFWYVSPIPVGEWMAGTQVRFGVLEPAHVHEGEDPAQPYLGFVDGAGQGARLRWPRCTMPTVEDGVVRTTLPDWTGDTVVELRVLDVAAGKKLGADDNFIPGDPDHEEWFLQQFRSEA